MFYLQYLASAALYFLFILLPFAGWSSNDPLRAGARSAGMAGAGVTLSDVWSITNNVAGVAALTKPAVGVYTQNRFNLKALSTVTLQAAYPVAKYGVVGAEVARFGDQWYNEQTIGLGLAHKLGPVSLGLKANILQVHVEGLSSRRTVALSMGGQAEFIPNLVFGAHAYNLNQARLGRDQDEHLPTVLKAGLAYKSSTKFILTIETEKNIELPADLRAGLEYTFIEKLALRTGFSTATQSATAGVGFQARHFTFDYALGSHSVLGVSNYLSVGYRFE